MPKGYWVGFADVTDPEGYKAYIVENAKAFRKHGGRFLVRGGRYEAPEGKPRSRTVVIEFPTYSAALECYRSPERQGYHASAGQIAYGPLHRRRLRRPSARRHLTSLSEGKDVE
jgi:uncharacterized protein (DUF1330 family)